MVNLGELDRISLPTGTTLIETGTTLIEVDKLPQMEIIRLQGDLNRASHRIYTLEQGINTLAKNRANRKSQNCSVQR